MGISKGKTPYDYTQSFWIGCQPVSEGCLHCYARAKCQQRGRDFDKVVRSKTWKDPLKWQKEAAAAGEVRKVFTCIWSDFFHAAANEWRAEAWSVIKNTPNLVWQVLTKRAELIENGLPEDWGEGYPPLTDYPARRKYPTFPKSNQIPGSARPQQIDSSRPWNLEASNPTLRNPANTGPPQGRHK